MCLPDPLYSRYQVIQTGFGVLPMFLESPSASSMGRCKPVVVNKDGFPNVWRAILGRCGKNELQSQSPLSCCSLRAGQRADAGINVISTIVDCGAIRTLETGKSSLKQPGNSVMCPEAGVSNPQLGDDKPSELASRDSGLHPDASDGHNEEGKVAESHDLAAVY